MKNYREIFKNKVTLLPVVHCRELNETLRNVELCVKHNAHGIFLINHNVGPIALYNIYDVVRKKYPELWIGLNLLGETATDAFTKYVDNTINGLWSDNAAIRENKEEHLEAELTREKMLKAEWEGLYFGGVAFKYQMPVKDFTAVTKIAKDYMDVITTSGDGTGQAASISKIIEMHKAADGFPLAIASGVDIDNINDYWDHCDCFLVASSICRSFYNFDEDLLKNLIDKVNNKNNE